VLTFSSINNIARLNFKLGVPNARAGGLTAAAAARHSNTSYRAVAGHAAGQRHVRVCIGMSTL